MTLQSLYNAGRVRRWHTNPDLSHIDDYIDGHAGRVTRLVAFLWPSASGRLLRAALAHDDGEYAVGDMAATMKRQYPELAEILSDMEHAARRAIWGADQYLTPVEQARLKFADNLDAWMVAQRHAPHVLSGDGWPEQRAWLIGQSHALGVAHVVEGVL